MLLCQSWHTRPQFFRIAISCHSYTRTKENLMNYFAVVRPNSYPQISVGKFLFWTLFGLVARVQQLCWQFTIITKNPFFNETVLHVINTVYASTRVDHSNAKNSCNIHFSSFYINRFGTYNIDRVTSSSVSSVCDGWDSTIAHIFQSLFTLSFGHPWGSFASCNS